MNQEHSEINALIELLKRLPGLGPTSSKRIVLDLIKSDSLRMMEIAEAMQRVAKSIRKCSECGNFCKEEICSICSSTDRANGELCVVQDVADLWAMERTNAFKGRYHVLGGVLSMLDNVGPEELGVPTLIGRVSAGSFKEVILALSATVEGQTTAYYIADQLAEINIRATSLGLGVPMGGTLDYLDDGTITAALNSRR